MSVHTEYRATTALGIDQDGNLRWQGPEYGHWHTDEQEAREIYAARIVRRLGGRPEVTL